MEYAIYPFLRLNFISYLLGFLCEFLNKLLLVPTTYCWFLSLVALALHLYALAGLRPVSDRFVKAFRYAGIYAAVSSVLTVLLFLSAFSGFLLFLLLLFSSFSFVSSYHFYWGLDEQIAVRGYAFPPSRLHRAFYWELIGIASFSGLLVLTLLTLAIDLAPLIIFYPFMQVVKTHEQAHGHT